MPQKWDTLFPHSLGLSERFFYGLKIAIIRYYSSLNGKCLLEMKKIVRAISLNAFLESYHFKPLTKMCLYFMEQLRKKNSTALNVISVSFYLVYFSHIMCTNGNRSNEIDAN